MLRRLLVTSAHDVLGPFGPDTDLRRSGLRLAERGGKAAKKRAVVATARKLAVLSSEGRWISNQADRLPGTVQDTPRRSRHGLCPCFTKEAGSSETAGSSNPPSEARAGSRFAPGS